MSQQEIINWLIANAKGGEWATRHAAENSYCPYCSNDDDLWTDQKEHHTGCEYVRMMAEAEKLVAS